MAVSTGLFGIIGLLGVSGQTSYEYLGCYGDCPDRTLKYGPHKYGYTIDSCYQYAVNNGWTYFALQDNGWCCTSNSYEEATAKGERTTCPDSGLGAGCANDLYEVVVPTTQPTEEPTRNCDLLHIDEFLLDCSVEWDNAGNAIETNTASITAAAASANSSINALEKRIAALEHIMDQLDVNRAAAKYAPGNVDVVAPVSGMSGGITLTVKDIGILVLMAMNMVMIAIMMITCKRQSGRRTKYQVVSVGSDIEPING